MGANTVVITKGKERSAISKGKERCLKRVVIVKTTALSVGNALFRTSMGCILYYSTAVLLCSKDKKKL